MPMKKKKAKKPNKARGDATAPQPERSFPGGNDAPGNPGKGRGGSGGSAFVQRTRKATGRGG